MKLRTFAATAAAATIGASSLLIPAASAATVEFEGNQCKITVSEQDIAAMRAQVLNSNPDAEEQVKAAFPGLDAELDILLDEVETQILTDLKVDSQKFSPAGKTALNAYLAAGAKQGYTQDDLILILVSPVIPKLLGKYFDTEGQALTGTYFMYAHEAKQQISMIDYYLKASGFDAASGKFLGLQASEKAAAIVTPALDTMTVFADQVQQPFRECIAGSGGSDGEDTDPGGDGNGSGDDDSGGGGDTPGDDNDGGAPGGNQGGYSPGSGGSSFGSS